MQVWMMKDGQKVGPLEINQLSANGLTPTTPVWYDGLADWMPASQAPATQGLFVYTQAQPQNTATTAGAEGTGQPTIPCPPNYMVWAILTLLCCCLPFGIVAVVYASQVNSKWACGDYAGAQKASNNAKTWSLVA